MSHGTARWKEKSSQGTAHRAAHSLTEWPTESALIDSDCRRGACGSAARPVACATYLGVAAERVLQQVRQLRVPVPDSVSPPCVCAQSAHLTPPHPPPQKQGPHDISGLCDAMGTVLDASLTTASGGRVDCVLCARDVRIARRQRVDHVTKRLHRSIAIGSALWCAPVLATSHQRKRPRRAIYYLRMA